MAGEATVMDETQNVKDLRRFFEHMAQRDTVRKAIEMIAPDCVAVEPAGLPYAGTYVGPEGFLSLMKAVTSWAVLDIEKLTLRDAGDVVQARFQLTIRPVRGGGYPFETEIVELYEVREGRVHGISIFYHDTASVSRALGATHDTSAPDLSAYVEALEYISPTTGTYEEALEFVGRCGDWVEGPAAVSEAMVKMFSSSIHDAHPGYWDTTSASEIWGAPVAPPALLQSSTLPLPWTPPGSPITPSLQFAVPLPGDSLIVVSTETLFHQPIVVGDRLRHQEEILDISEERATRLGRGHFMTTRLQFADSDGRAVATVTNVLLRFTKETS